MGSMGSAPKNLISNKPLHIPLEELKKNLFFLPADSMTLNEGIFAFQLYQCKEAVAMRIKKLSYQYTN